MFIFSWGMGNELTTDPGITLKSLASVIAQMFWLEAGCKSRKDLTGTFSG
jgi:hypothetical protein